MKSWPNKDPNEILDFDLDWANPLNPVLVTNELLTSSIWTLVSGDVVMGNGSNGAIAPTYAPSGLSVVWLLGGTDGTVSVLNNRVTTSMGRTYEQEIQVRVREH